MLPRSSTTPAAVRQDITKGAALSRRDEDWTTTTESTLSWTLAMSSLVEAAVFHSKRPISMEIK